MQTFSLENQPEGLKTARKTAAINAIHMKEPFKADTQEGVLEYGPETCDDWGEGYVLSFPDDGSKPYAMSKTFFDGNYAFE